MDNWTFRCILQLGFFLVIQANTITLYQPLLHRIAYNIVRCKEDAEDIVQETFLKILTKKNEQIDNLKAYLIKSVVNSCLNHLETIKRKKEEFMSLDLKDVVKNLKETKMPAIDLEIHIDHALKLIHTRLEPLERAVFMLREVLDFDYDSIQEAFDKKKDHCRQLVSRAKKKLQEEKDSFHIELPDLTKFIEAAKKAMAFNCNHELVEKLKSDLKTQKK